MTESCPVCGKQITTSPTGVYMRSHMRTHNKGPADIGDLAADPMIGSPLDSDPPVSPFEDQEHPPPVKPKRSLRDRILGPKPPAEQRPRSSERTPQRPRAKRVDPSDMLARGVGWVGRKVEEMYSVPTGRAIVIEAEPAGLILTDAIRDTMIDRPVQWAARQYAAGSIAFALFRFPLAVEMGARQIVSGDGLSPMVEKEIMESLLDLAPYLVKVVKREVKKQRDFEEAMEGLRDVFGVPEGQPVTLGHVLGYLYPVAGGPIPATARVA